MQLVVWDKCHTGTAAKEALEYGSRKNDYSAITVSHSLPGHHIPQSTPHGNQNPL